MANKKIKLLKDAVIVSSIDIPHYNKNQIINFKCSNCRRDVSIKYSSFIKKTSLLCRDCQSKVNSDYVSRDIKISEAKKKSPINHEKAVTAQTSRSVDAKKATIEKFKKTMSTKDKSEMKLRMKAAMTAEQKQRRVELFQESYYKSQRDKIIKHAALVLGSKSIKYTENNFLFNCIYPECGTEWTWSPLKKSEYFTGKSYVRLEKDTKNGYIYTNSRITYSRYQCQKHKLKNILKDYNPELTEYENMSTNGFFRLYDFGQSVFTWRKK